jgi:hypothetical protein
VERGRKRKEYKLRKIKRCKVIDKKMQRRIRKHSTRGEVNTVKEEMRGNCSSNKKDEESKRLEPFAAINSPCFWRILKKDIFFSEGVFTYRKSAKQENSSLFINSIL